MSNLWSLAELTELDLRMRPSAEPEVPESWQPDPDLNRVRALLKWLRETRNANPESMKISQTAARTETLIRLAVLLFSAIVGMGAAAGLLRYGGEQLINVSAYLGILVGGQLLMLLLLGISSLGIRFHGGIREHLFLPEVIRECPSPQSLPAWRWRIFTTFQWGGVAFNLGVLAATLWKVVTFDLAFGWATTLQVKTDTIASLTRILAMPWGGRFAPTLEQIERSRIVLLEGFSTVDPQSTASWWPFLCMCVAVYGLLPRVGFALLGEVTLQRRLRHPALSSPEAERLYQRLTRSPLRYQSSAASPSPGESKQGGVPALTPTRPMVLRIPDELKSLIDLPQFTATLQSELKIDLTESPGDTGVLFLVEAWQPPLEETLRTFREQRDLCGPDCEFLVLAVGLPNQSGGFRPPSPEDLEIWSQKLSTLRDPQLGLLPWRTST